MAYEKITREFDHLQYLPVLERMYASKDLEEIKEHASFSQVERFRKELETLEAFGLHKDLEVHLDRSKEEKTAARKFSDGKVDAIFSVSNAKIKETYRNSQNKKRYRRKIKHAFIESTAVKSNKPLSYSEENPPHCMNCGGAMEVESENYFCPYCRTAYEAEAYKYLVTRFFIEGAFHDLRYAWFFFGPVLLLALLQVKGFISQEQMEHLQIFLSYSMGILFTGLLFYALAKGFRDYLRHRFIQKKIRKHDPNFSTEIFTLRLNDLLGMQPDLLIPDKDKQVQPEGVICRNVLNLQFCDYQRLGNLEILDCRGKADALYLKGNPDQVRLKDKAQKFTVRLARLCGTRTPVHYLPDQFTCKNCGSHQMTEHAGMQVCSYCRTERPMESIDWVLYDKAL